MTNPIDPILAKGDEVTHVRFGQGLVEMVDGTSVIVRFERGLEAVPIGELSQRRSQLQAIHSESWDAPLEVLVRTQAEAILSTGNAWSVFSKSRIALLPHQLWVCRQVTERWPARWLVADDVGLGKTIEAGLILWPLLANEAVRRLLIICPASLVEQWQVRLREMFDIRLNIHSPEIDTPKSDFWNSQTHVIASLETLRLDRGDRQKRLVDSDPWDLLIVDEAHHLNADEKEGPTHGYRLIDKLEKNHRLESMIFFTGTPHRGKDFGFWSLLKLLNPDDFDPKKPAAEQLPKLREVMIRNNKQNVTDLQGERIFHPVDVRMDSYSYSPEEAHFYEMLTEFISSGKAYASTLASQNQSAVMLILISMQKLASSSVAAIRRSLENRLGKLADTRNRRNPRINSKSVMTDMTLQITQANEDNNFDELSDLEEDMTQLEIQLMEDEEEQLKMLLEAADMVKKETKIDKIMELLKSEFTDESVLMFTEYKATQSLVISEIHKVFGDRSVGFINGDNRAHGVLGSDGKPTTLSSSRQTTADRFNTGDLKFLVSTEAGGEGIDLQENCKTLFHIDLPWNPMRLHQRVGRLNRYGQKHPVKVIGLINPDTVESRIWLKLDTKIDNIMRAFGSAMGDPEDLKELVLGMTSPSLFNELFAEATETPPSSLDEWFDETTAQFGGQDAIDTVTKMVGNVAKFDFQQISDRIPRVDLPDMKPFFKSAITLAGRQVSDDGGRLSFKTPREWASDFNISAEYDGVVFDRGYKGEDANARILGVGHPIINTSIKWAQERTARVASFPTSILAHPLCVYRIHDRITSSQGTVTSAVSAVEMAPDGAKILLDWELLIVLNRISEGSGIRRPSSSARPRDIDQVEDVLARATAVMNLKINTIDLPYEVPQVTPLAILWPADN